MIWTSAPPSSTSQRLGRQLIDSWGPESGSVHAGQSTPPAEQHPQSSLAVLVEKCQEADILKYIAHLTINHCRFIYPSGYRWRYMQVGFYDLKIYRAFSRTVERAPQTVICETEFWFSNPSISFTFITWCDRVKNYQCTLRNMWNLDDE